MTTRMPTTMTTPIHTHTHTHCTFGVVLCLLIKTSVYFCLRMENVMEKSTLMLLLHVLIKIIVIIKVTTANDVLTKFDICT